MLGPDGERSDGNALDELEGVEPEQRAVLEGAGLALGAVADHEAGAPGCGFPQRGPLAADREPGAAPPPQPRGGDDVDGGLRAHPEGVGKPLTTPERDPVGD